MVGPVYAEVVNSPLQTPVSTKAGKTNKTPRVMKCTRTGPQTPLSNVGEFYHSKFLEWALVLVSNINLSI